jgi:D-glycero-D-manno-heptose 1,7-bisphosphate phosphatase
MRENMSGKKEAPRSAVLLDRDGTILDDPGYLADPDKIVFFPGAAESMKRLQDKGYLLIVVTNQSGIGRGYFDEETGIAVNLRMTWLLKEKGLHLSGL